MRAKFLSVALLINALCWGALQIDTPAVAPESDVADLFQRLSASNVLIVGTIGSVKGVAQRLSESDRENRTKPGAMKGTVIVSLDGLSGGSLFDVKVQETICDGSDFQTRPTIHGVLTRGDTVQIFVPDDEPEWIDGLQKERLAANHRYLLFLEIPTPETRKAWIQRFQLDPSQTYYRAHLRHRGVVPLPERSSHSDKRRKVASVPVLEKATRLCAAVRPSDVDDKIKNLERLEKSDDVDLEREARLARAALEKHPR